MHSHGDGEMAQIMKMSQVQRNSQRGVGTACQSTAGSHSQGCHWRKRLESCIKTERDKGQKRGGGCTGKRGEVGGGCDSWRKRPEREPRKGKV